jgi:hypothetical protein
MASGVCQKSQCPLAKTKLWMPQILGVPETRFRGRSLLYDRWRPQRLLTKQFHAAKRALSLSKHAEQNSDYTAFTGLLHDGFSRSTGLWPSAIQITVAHSSTLAFFVVSSICERKILVTIFKV